MSVFEISSIVNFSHFVFKCRKHNYFCCEFLLGLLILNLCFVVNFEVEYCGIMRTFMFLLRVESKMK